MQEEQENGSFHKCIAETLSETFLRLAFQILKTSLMFLPRASQVISNCFTLRNPTAICGVIALPFPCTCLLPAIV